MPMPSLSLDPNASPAALRAIRSASVSFVRQARRFQGRVQTGHRESTMRGSPFFKGGNFK